jgi:hypothetical protein
MIPRAQSGSNTRYIMTLLLCLSVLPRLFRRVSFSRPVEFHVQMVLLVYLLFVYFEFL